MYHRTLADLFDGGPVSPYTNVTNNRSLTAQHNKHISSIEGFEINLDNEPNRIVEAIHLMASDVDDPDVDTITLTYPNITQAADVNSIKRFDVAGYKADLTPIYDSNEGITVTVPVVDDPCSPVWEWYDWDLDNSMYNFYVVLTRE